MNMTRVTTALFCVAVVSLLATGCARKPKLDVNYMGGAGSEFGRGPVDTTMFPPVDTPFAPRDSGPVAGPGIDDWTTVGDPLSDRAGAGIVPTEQRWADVVVYFGYDSAAIGPSERPKLEVLAEHLKSYPTYSTIIEGHCDERGSDEYNRSLGETRALVVRDYLISLGIDGSRLETLSYGEERPVVANATSEAQHQKNRRAEFIIGTRR